MGGLDEIEEAREDDGDFGFAFDGGDRLSFVVNGLLIVFGNEERELRMSLNL